MVQNENIKISFLGMKNELIIGCPPYHALIDKFFTCALNLSYFNRSA